MKKLVQILLFMLLLISCEDNNKIYNQISTVSTTNIIYQGSTFAISGGTVSNDGGAYVTERGVCWSTNQEPKITDNKYPDGKGMGSFTCNFSGLSPNTTYYVRAYAINSIGTAYGETTSFTTKNGLSTVSITGVGNIDSTSVTVGYAISNDGNYTITQRGVCWSTNASPSIADNKTSDGTDVGTYSSNITGLKPNTTYYVRAYSTNSVGTSYSATKPFTTNSKLPSILTISITNIDLTTVKCSSIIGSDGIGLVQERGVCWSTSPNSKVYNNIATGGAGVGGFKSSITGLIMNTTYYVRAYAIINDYVYYGNEISFNTMGAVTDIDGNTYRTVTIGTQTWMVDNLKTTKYRDGTIIPNVTNSWGSLTTGAWCDYNNLAANGIKYGHLYNWYAVNDSRNIAPVGWHIPSDAECTILENYLIAHGGNYDGTFTGNKLDKSLADTTDWAISTTIGAPGNDLSTNNSSGFNALPAGKIYTSNIFYNILQYGF